jgi:hypothetical protein
MTTAIRRRRGTTAQHSTFIGLEGETTIDTDKEVVVVHDGTTQGGFPLMRENGSNSALALGSAGTPSLKFTGDTNTGIYSPGADQVAISTNGTGRLFVDASGNVGVGAAPVVPLDIQQAQATQRLYSTTGTNTSHIQFRNTGGIAYVGLDSSTGGSFGAAYGLSLAHTGAYPITFVTNGLERMRLDSSGRLGLGTSSPSSKLSVNSGAANTFAANFYGPLATSDSVLLGVSDDGATKAGIGFQRLDGFRRGSFFIFNNNDANASTNGSISDARLTITSAGLVGIGTSSPERPLHVIGTGRFDNGAIDSVYTGTTTGDQLGIFRTYGVGAGVTGEVDLIGRLESGSLSNSYFSINTTFSGVIGERLRVDSSGRVGIGTTSPSTTLDVEGNIAFGDTSTGAAIISTVKGGNSIYFGVDNSTGSVFGTGTAYSPVIYTGAAAPITFSNSGTERARIDSSGRLLVGTSSSILSYANLQVTGGSDNAGHVCLANGGTAPVNGANIGSIRFTNSAGGIGAQFNCEADGAWTAGSNYRSRLTFSTTADGASSPTERMRINSNGAVGTFTADGVTSLNVSTAATAGTATIAAAIRYGATAVYGGTISLQIYSNGNVQNTNNSYGAISDVKLKENIVDANSQWDDLKALQVRNYNLKEGQTHTQIGLVAQEAELVSPGLVSESPDRDEEGNDLGTVTKSVNYSVLYMKAVKALQEAMERIETLEAKVAALEGA